MKVFLTFICRDNEDVIAEMIQSCLPLVDGIVACDTGSKDSTIDYIKNICSRYEQNALKIKNSEKKKMPVYIYEDKWVNFGHNRTLMMEHCQRNHKNVDYWLVMDTDETLEIIGKPDRDKWEADCIRIVTKDDGYSYPRDRIFANRLKWHWVGAAHEFPEAEGIQTRAIDETLQLKLKQKQNNDHVYRNLELLLQDEKTNPEDPRTLFYLAQTYRDLKDFKKAKHYYMKRASMKNTWEEEVWFSWYALGIASHMLEEYDEAEMFFLKAYEIRSKRAEPLHKLAIMLQQIGQNNKAEMYIFQAGCIEKPEDDSLFVEDSIYDWGCDYVKSYVYYYSKDHDIVEEGYDLACNLADHYENKMPDNYYEQLLNNIQLYDRRYIESGNPKKFVIELPTGFDGLGDHLLFSQLPFIFKAKYPGVSVYVSEFNTYKTDNTMELVWENHPEVDGFIKAKGTYFDIDAIGRILRDVNIIKGMSPMQQISAFYGVYDPELDYPYIKWEPTISERFNKYKGLKIFDGNWKHFIGVTSYEVLKYIKDNKIKIDYQIAPFEGTNYIEIPGVPKIKLSGIEDYMALYLVAGKFNILMTGTAIMFAAAQKSKEIHTGVTFIGPDINVFAKQTNPKCFKFDKIHKYINL